MIMRDERDMSILRRQLSRLGMSVTETDPGALVVPDSGIDVIVLDADSIPIKLDSAPQLKTSVPVKDGAVQYSAIPGAGEVVLQP